MKLYGIPNCNTVKKARSWLAEHQVAADFHDFRKDGLDEPLLQGWLAQVSWEKLVNRAGMTWRHPDDDTKQSVKANASASQLMLENTAVIKRPVLVEGGKKPT